MIIFAIIYLVLHSLLNFVRMVALNVACNSSINSLLTLLISNNFVELKSSVFKKFEPENLFQVNGKTLCVVHRTHWPNHVSRVTLCCRVPQLLPTRCCCANPTHPCPCASMLPLRLRARMLWSDFSSFSFFS